MYMGKHLLLILAFADIQKIHVESGTTTKQLIQEVERVTERLTEKIVNKKTGEILAYRLKGTYAEYLNNRLKALHKLGELETAEEDGKLVVLPCKPWDIVYQLFVTDVIDKKLIYKIFQAKVTEITIDRFRTIFSFETLDENKYKSDLTMESFGETVFLTREEAEKALKETEGKHE